MNWCWRVALPPPSNLQSGALPAREKKKHSYERIVVVPGRYRLAKLAMYSFRSRKDGLQSVLRPRPTFRQIHVPPSIAANKREWRGHSAISVTLLEGGTAIPNFHCVPCL